MSRHGCRWHTLLGQHWCGGVDRPQWREPFRHEVSADAPSEETQVRGSDGFRLFRPKAVAGAALHPQVMAQCLRHALLRKQSAAE